MTSIDECPISANVRFASVLWLLMLASGVHATIASVVADLTVPLAINEAHSPAGMTEQGSP
jgi:Na+/H+ antiporter NhaA